MILLDPKLRSPDCRTHADPRPRPGRTSLLSPVDRRRVVDVEVHRVCVIFFAWSAFVSTHVFSMTVADFRSDTVTQPTLEMREAMQAAIVGDDVLGDDPTVHQLEVEAAAFLGHEAALFTPSGTMANVIGVSLHVQPGDEVLLEAASPINRSEGGGLAAICGAMPRPLSSVQGVLDPERVRASISPPNDHFCRTRLLCVENTHNMSGGSVVPLDAIKALRAVCEESGLALHLDGARLVNAAVAAGVPAAAYAGLADTATLCLSKALGAPVGSVLAGSAASIRTARRIRKRLGGGMRQAGTIAAAALVALHTGPAKLAADHARARRLADQFQHAASRHGLSKIVAVGPPQTNILFVRLTDQPTWYAPLVARLEAEQIRAIAVPAQGIRFVLHHQIDDEMIERAAQVFDAALQDLASREPAFLDPHHSSSN